MNMKQDKVKRMKGFTLIELLVSVTIFIIVILGVYAFFDQGNWLYLQSENRSALQDNARILIESLEHDLRMAGSRTPKQGNVGGGTLWVPLIFTADKSKIYFRSDIDSRNGRLMADAASGASSFTVENPETICPDPPATTQLVIIRNGKIWEAETCASADDSTNTLTIGGSTSRLFESETSVIATPEHIFYRMQNDADADGECDITLPPFCTVEKAIVYGNDPTTNNDPTTATFEPIATNIYKLELSYLDFDGTSLGATPITTNLAAIGRVVVNVEARDYASGDPRDARMRAGSLQAVVMSTDILIRARF